MKRKEMKKKIKWLPKPASRNYPAAQSYLSLMFDPFTVEKYIKQLQCQKISYFKAKDIFRASKLSLLGISNSHIEKNYKKIKNGEPLSPILLMRDGKDRMVIVADGYHRMCAVYHIDEDILIPCQIGDLMKA